MLVSSSAKEVCMSFAPLIDDSGPYNSIVKIGRRALLDCLLDGHSIYNMPPK